MTNIDDYMKDKEFFKWNPFLKGYIYGEERKNQFSGVTKIFTKLNQERYNIFSVVYELVFIDKK